MESELVRPDTDHAPAIEQHDAQHDNVEHDFGAELEALLHGPKSPDTD
jgi:hypothetical protein